MAEVEIQNTQEDLDLNYFVCTLGEAAAINTNNPHSWRTVNDFIDYQAEKFPKHPAVGFPIPSDGIDKDLGWGSVIYSMSVPRQRCPYSTNP